MGALIASLLAGLVSFLPRGTRRWFAHDEELYRPALVTGILQYLLCASIVLGRLVAFIQTNVGAVGASAIAQGNDVVLNQAQYDVGFVIATGYLFRPGTVLLFYLTCEGLVRFFAAAVTHEVVGTAPLHLLVRTCRLCVRLGTTLARNRTPGIGISRGAETKQSYCPLELRSDARPPSAGQRKRN